MGYFYPLIVAVIGLIAGFSAEGDTNDKSRQSNEKFWEVIKWISIVVLFLYALLIVGALTDGIGDIPLIGGTVWVRGHWRRR